MRPAPGQRAGNALPADLPVVETVNGQDVPQVLLDMLARERNLDLAVPEQRARALTELTDYILLSQAASSEAYAKDPAFAAEVEINRLHGNANATLAKFRSSAHVDDSVLHTEYHQQIASAGKSEYDFSQLLFDNEDDALKAAGEAMSKAVQRGLRSLEPEGHAGARISAGAAGVSCRLRSARPWLR